MTPEREAEARALLAIVECVNELYELVLPISGDTDNRVAMNMDADDIRAWLAAEEGDDGS